MSKKKVTGSTMTLKDFHGGSIPSDLPLPSAPGVIVRNSDRSGMDRSIPSVWGSPINRTEYRRPGSAGNSRGFDDKAAFFSQPANIGLNFDEDERKPLDSGPRRNTVDDDNRNARSDRFMSNRVDFVPTESKVSVRPSVASRPAVLQARPSSGGGVPAGAPNAWGMRKESGFQEEIPSQMPYSTQSVAAKLATASAVDKVSSGKWQSKLIVSQVPPSPSPPPIYQSEVESRSLGRYNEIGSSSFPSASNPPGVDLDPGNNKNHYSNVRFSEEQKYREEGAQNTGRGYGGDYDSVRHGRPVSSEGKTGTQGVQEVSERPKLKLLPRSKPMEQQDLQVKDQKHDAGNVEVYDEGISNVAHPQIVGSVAGDASGKAVERPKLNLKPRSQPVDQSDETAERERNALFGGARPRELVLKERGVDDTVINGMDSVPVRPTSSGKHDSHQPDAKTEQPNARAGERSETFTGNRRTGQVERMDVTERRDYERKDHRADPERADAQRNTRRNDNWRNEKDVEKNQERNHPEVDSWRKPEPMTSPEPQATRHSRVASAMELAQAFSKSVSVAKPDKIINQRSLPSRLVDNGSVPAQAPVLFSRLTDGHRQINGY